MTRPSYQHWHYDNCYHGHQSYQSYQSYQRPRTSNAVASPRPRRPERQIANTATTEPGLALEFVNQPPREVQRGSPIHDPVTLVVRAESPVNDGLHQYFAVASLVSTDNQNAPPHSLTGPKLADSLRAYDAPPRSDVMGYLSFPNLSMQSSGSYKLRVTLMKFDTRDSPGQSAAVALQAVDSGKIEVTTGRESYRSYYDY